MAVEPFAGLEMPTAKSSKRVGSTWNITKNTSKPPSYANARPGGLYENIIVSLTRGRTLILSSLEGESDRQSQPYTYAQGTYSFAALSKDAYKALTM